jgi:preprotein translocase subunit SecG
MFIVITMYIIYLLVSVGLILIIMIQQGKGGGLAGAFGGGGGETFFGHSSMQQIGKITIGLAVTFLVLSLLIANIPMSPTSDSVIDFGDTSTAAPVPIVDPGGLPAGGPEQPAPVPVVPDVPE